MPIFYRTPNLTFVNVGQSMPKFYRESFQKGQLDYMYERTNCPCNVALERPRQSVVSQTCKLITKGETIKLS